MPSKKKQKGKKRKPAKGQRPPPPPPPGPQPEGTTGAAVVYPSGTSVDPGSGTPDPWETPQYLLGIKNDGQRWVEMEVRFWEEPPRGFVERWLRQTLRFEIGERLSHVAMRLMKGEVRNPRAAFARFVGEVLAYLKRHRPMPSKGRNKTTKQ